MQIIGEVTARLLERGTGRVVREATRRNVITDTGLALAVGRMIHYEPQRISYVAIGTGSTAAATADESLETEVARTEINTYSDSGAVATIGAFFTSAECTYLIREIGVFGGSAWSGQQPSATLDSGQLFSRTVVNLDNSAGNYDLSVEWSYTFARE